MTGPVLHRSSGSLLVNHPVMTVLTDSTQRLTAIWTKRRRRGPAYRAYQSFAHAIVVTYASVRMHVSCMGTIPHDSE